METLMLLRQTIQMAKKHENLGFFGGKFSDYISTYRSMKLQSYNFLHLFLCKKIEKKIGICRIHKLISRKNYEEKNNNNNDAPNFISSLLLLKMPSIKIFEKSKKNGKNFVDNFFS